MPGAGTPADFSMGNPGRFEFDFELSANGGYAPTPQEQAYLERVQSLLSTLAEVRPKNDAVSPERVRVRSGCILELRKSVDVFRKHSRGPERDQHATTSIHQSYMLEGRYRERVLRLEAIPFIVTTIPPDTSATVTDIRIDVRDVHIPDDKQHFKVAIDQAVTVVKATIASSEREQPHWSLRWLTRIADFDPSPQRIDAQQKLNDYLRGLAGIARVGLMSVDATQTPFAVLALDGFKAEFVAREAGTVKNNYVRRLGVNALVAMLVAVACYLLVRGMAGETFMFRFRNFFLLVAGAAVGTWLSFSIRRVVLGFSDLVNLENDRLNPGLRVLFIIALTTVVGLLFWTGAVTVGVGEFRSSFQVSGTDAILIGTLCGIAERAMATAVGRRTEDFAAGIGGPSRPSG